MVHEFMHKLGNIFVIFCTLFHSLYSTCYDYYVILICVFVPGFYHEHTRPDRDDYITVHDDVIDRLSFQAGTDYSKQFKPCAKDGCRISTRTYDYGSIMHYKPTVGENGEYTIMTAKSNCPNPPCRIRYQRTSLTQKDIEGINKVYGCSSNSGKCQSHINGTCK